MDGDGSQDSEGGMILVMVYFLTSGPDRVCVGENSSSCTFMIGVLFCMRVMYQ